MGETEIRLALNRASADYCDKTELIKSTYTQTSVAGQRYYTLDGTILRITDVQINDVSIPRLIGKPVIDDDEFDAQVGLEAGTQSSNDRYWYTSNDRLGLVEKIPSVASRDDKQSDYQSISVATEIRIFSISKASDFTIDLTEISSLPTQFHDALIYRVIADGYLKAGLEAFNPKVSQLFDIKYKELIKDGKKRARAHYNASATMIKPTEY